MLVDDNEIDNFIHQQLLESICPDSKILIHSDVNSALDYCENLVQMGQPLKNQIPEYLFLDLFMPVLDGFSFLERFHKLENTFNIKIVILTVSLIPDHREKALKYNNVTGFILKPLLVKQLREIINLYRSC